MHEAADNPSRLIAAARRTFQIESAAVAQLSDRLDGTLGERFVAAVGTMKAATGRIILTGMGKSGQIARKIASTLASTGTPAMFVHPSDASHGDLGMITGSDVIIVLSWSGETEELRNIVAYSRRFQVPMIAITAVPESALAKSADIVLALPVCEEACPNGLAPTTSTTLQLVLGDALAIALLEDRGFTASDFRRLHPGGKLGAALTFVRDIMHVGDQLPLVPETMAMSDAVVVMTEKSFGCLGIVDTSGHLAGIITDGDLRRHMTPNLLSLETGAVMTRNPLVASPDDLASSVLDQLNKSSITSLFVVRDREPVGIVHIHDLLRLGVA
jgi:arabinose-5-phosphate isomerase